MRDACTTSAGFFGGTRAEKKKRKKINCSNLASRRFFGRRPFPARLPASPRRHGRDRAHFILRIGSKLAEVRCVYISSLSLYSSDECFSIVEKWVLFARDDSRTQRLLLLFLLFGRNESDAIHHEDGRHNLVCHKTASSTPSPSPRSPWSLNSSNLFFARSSQKYVNYPPNRRRDTCIYIGKGFGGEDSEWESKNRLEQTLQI